MKVFVVVAVVILQTTVRLVSSQNIVNAQLYTIESCIPKTEYINDATLEQYRKVQVITDLDTDIPLRDIARRPLLDEKNGNYNQFLGCTWKNLGYEVKRQIAYDKIEMALRKAFIREVGGTGPGINLSKVEAKRIVDNCRNTTGYTPGQRAVRVQICVHKQIQHI